jgi:hypothetical protein
LFVCLIVCSSSVPTPGDHDDGLDEEVSESTQNNTETKQLYLKEQVQEQKETTGEAIVTPASDVISR